MKKVVLKGILGYAVLLSSLTSNAQVIVEENFQTFGNSGYVLTSGAPKDNSTCAGQPDEKNIELKRTYPSGTEVTYSLVNSGISSTCPVKGGSLDFAKVGSIGYIELGRLSEYTVTNLPGSLTISKLPYVGTITFNASWTGGNRTGTPREGVLYKSDDRVNWTVVDVTAVDPENRLTGFFGDVYGAQYTAVINGSYYIKFETVTELATENRYRIHDLTIDATLVSVKDMFVDGSASVWVNQKAVQVKSAQKGLLEIVGMDGKVLHSSNIAAGVEQSIQVSQSGMYAVRLVVGNSASVQKIIVQ